MAESAEGYYVSWLRDKQLAIDVLKGVRDNERKVARKLRERAAAHDKMADAIGDLIDERMR